VEALLPLGLRRVVLATVDPNPSVRGRSVRRLRAGGVVVSIGTGADEANAIMAGYRSHVLRGRPLVTLKLAATLDGRIAARTGDARWITGPAARRRGARAARRARRDPGRRRARCAPTTRSSRAAFRAGGIRSGSSHPDRRSTSRAREDLDVKSAPTWIVVPVGADPRECGASARAASRSSRCREARQHSAAGLMKTLAARGITTLLVEGGASSAADLLALGLVDRSRGSWRR
jgi:diaminohydroxyphosphoribosylaminopyrimidine deaminase/5-amino-6-(5-phosphoribosylamino)uracil reductase